MNWNATNYTVKIYNLQKKLALMRNENEVTFNKILHTAVCKSVALHTTLTKYVPSIARTAKRTLVGRCRHHGHGEIMLASFF